jgi:hypothetical protein
MTYTATVDDRQNSGSFETVWLTVDVTSLANANNEPINVGSEADLDEVSGVAVLGYEESGSQIAQYDHLEGALYFEGYGGTDPTSGTDVGEVRLRVDGNPAP